MIVGVCRLELVLPGNDSLKGKRRVRRSLVDRARNKFQLTVAEVEAQDVLQTLVLGAAYVSNEAVHAERLLHRFVDWVDSTGHGYIRSSQVQLLRPDLMGPALGGRR